MGISKKTSIWQLAMDAMAAPLPMDKLQWMDQLHAAVSSASIADEDFNEFVASVDQGTDTVTPISRRSAPRPVIVSPDQVPRRRPTTVAGRAALLHAIAHIEYSAIDLALDHALRFKGLPSKYYRDWLQVACDEARHFVLLRDHLCSLGHDYGDFPAHDGLWQMAEKTADDPLARMAMVPRLLEARGLDATPPIQRKLAEVGDTEAVRVLDVILHDEEGHVRLGDYWFRHLCRERGLAPEATFRELNVRYQGPWPQTPMNETARLAAGFSPAELHDLTEYRPPR